MQDHYSQFPSGTTPVVLIGTIFAREKLFLTLPTDLQEETRKFRAYVETDKRWLFRTHHHALVKSVYSVRGSELLDVIIHWLQTRSTPSAHEAATDADLPVDSTADRHGGLRDRAATFPASNHSKTNHQGTNDELESAMRIAEALVLMGFITPFKDDEKHLTSIAPGHYVHEKELLVPIAASVSEITTTTVWSVLDGAVYARSMKRKSGLKGKFGHGKDVFVLFNDKTKKLYLFASDVAREPVADIYGPTFDVAFDNSCFEFGVRVSHKSGLEKEKPQFFNAESESVQLEFLLACINIGANYAEGNVRKLLDAYESRLLARYGIASADKQVEQSTEARDAAMAGTVVDSMSGTLGRESYLETEARSSLKQVDNYPVDAAFSEPAAAS